MQDDVIPVSTLAEYLKRMIDAEQLLYRIKIFGELSAYNVSNGNAYFIIKDQDAVMNCVMFNCFRCAIPKIGDKLIVTGSPKYYVKGGKLSFNVETIEQFGQGELYFNFLKLKEKLEKEGLFDIAHKKPFPQSINKIGVVTAENGAVIHDIINVATRRNKNIQIVLFPTKVQGIGAENEIAKGIEYFSNSKVDAVIVCRGGGSQEDLQPYNTEIVARTAYNCSKFLVSAVGHETDYSLLDFVADLRAPTPSAAAELLVKEVVNLKETIDSYEKQLKLKYENILNYNKMLLKEANQLLVYKMQNIIDRNASKVELLMAELKSKNPLTILEKGYAKLSKNSKTISSINEISNGDLLDMYLKDGKVKVEVKDINGKL